MSAPLLQFEPVTRIIGSLFGSAVSRRRGISDDIVGSRAYQSGDDIRRINWAASARLSALSGTDQFVVRESYSEEAPIVCLVVDRSRSMGLYPTQFPWLHKPDALREVGALVATSAAYYRCPVAYLDELHWQAPRPLDRFNTVTERLTSTDFPLDDKRGGDQLFLALQAREHLLPPGSFVFIMSDFCIPPSSHAISLALDAEWDMIPVIIRDPIWEQSYPEAVAGVSIPLPDSEGVVRYLRQSKEQVEEKREANERSLAETDRVFAEHGFPPLLIGSTEPESITEAFRLWCKRRDLL